MIPEVAANKARRLRELAQICAITAIVALATVAVALGIYLFAKGPAGVLPVAAFEAFVSIVAFVSWLRIRRQLQAVEKFL